jgi:aryl sulfotransferase
MTASESVWPRKSREPQSAKFDSTVWNSFTFRDGDIVIAIYEKAGTTWTQQIVSQLVFEGAANVAVQTISPWVDLPLPPAQEKLAMLDAQRHRRFVKTHLPVDALVYAPEARHLYVGRDGRDIAWSLYNHLVNYTDAYLAQLNSVSGWAGPKLEKPNGSAKEFFLDWIRRGSAAPTIRRRWTGSGPTGARRRHCATWPRMPQPVP